MEAADRAAVSSASDLRLKTLVEREELLTSGHRLCPGCAEPIVVRQVLMACPGPAVVVLTTGCLEVSSTVYPTTAWRVPAIHSAFENSAATASGIVAAYEALRRKGRRGEPAPKVIVFGGDGGTYDIGLQSLSGALERGTSFLYVCLNNEGYMNTGIQRSGATPLYAWTTTSPVGSLQPGKIGWRKNLTDIVVAHNIPYVAQTAPSALKPHDLKTKVAKAFAADGPAFINVLACCPRGWRSDAGESITLTQNAIDSCYWPLFEVDQGKWHLSYRPQQKKPIGEWLKGQARFSHVLKNPSLVEEVQRRVDGEWETLLRRCGVVVEAPAQRLAPKPAMGDAPGSSPDGRAPVKGSPAPSAPR